MSAPRVCGDDPIGIPQAILLALVLPAYAGMILACWRKGRGSGKCSPRMRG